MTLTVNIPEEVGRRLSTEAARQGVDESEFAQRLISQALPARPPAIDQATLDLIAQWDREDQTNDPDEISRREREFEELKAAMNANRRGSGGPNARKIFP